MKKILLGFLILGMFGCNNSDYKNNKKELLNSAVSVSSSSYSVKIKQYLIENDTNVISFKVLDSIKIESDKYCDSIVSLVAEKVYK
jgi:hypothetical protein